MNPAKSDESKCRVCGKKNVLPGKWCPDCNKYNLAINASGGKHIAFQVVSSALVVAVLGWAIDCRVRENDTQETNGRLLREIAADEYASSMGELAEFQNLLAAIFANRYYMGECLYATTNLCNEHFAQRNRVIIDNVALAAVRSVTFADPRNEDVQLAIQTSWGLLFKWPVPQKVWEADVADCAGEASDDCAKLAKKSLSMMAWIQSRCLEYVACETSLRKAELDFEIAEFLRHGDLTESTRRMLMVLHGGRRRIESRETLERILNDATEAEGLGIMSSECVKDIEILREACSSMSTLLDTLRESEESGNQVAEFLKSAEEARATAAQRVLLRKDDGADINEHVSDAPEAEDH